jgi:hypothetical protein
MSKRPFVLGFLLGACGFVGINLYSYYTVEPPCCDFHASFGFPIPWGDYGGFAGYTIIHIPGLIEDALIGLLASIIFAWVFAKSWPPLLNLISHSLAALKALRDWHLNTRLHG